MPGRAASYSLLTWLVRSARSLEPHQNMRRRVSSAHRDRGAAVSASPAAAPPQASACLRLIRGVAMRFLLEPGPSWRGPSRQNDGRFTALVTTSVERPLRRILLTSWLQA